MSRNSPARLNLPTVPVFFVCINYFTYHRVPDNILRRKVYETHSRNRLQSLFRLLQSGGQPVPEVHLRTISCNNTG